MKERDVKVGGDAQLQNLQQILKAAYEQDAAKNLKRLTLINLSNLHPSLNDVGLLGAFETALRNVASDLPEIAAWLAEQNNTSKNHSPKNTIKKYMAEGGGRSVGKHDSLIFAIVQEEKELGTTPHFICKIAGSRGIYIADTSARKSLRRLMSKGLVDVKNEKWFPTGTPESEKSENSDEK